MPAARGEHPSESGSGLNLACCLWTDAAPLPGDPSSVSCHTKTTGTRSPSLSASLISVWTHTRGRAWGPGVAVPPTEFGRSRQHSPTRRFSSKEREPRSARAADPDPRATPLRLTAGAPDGHAQRARQRERAADDTRRHGSAMRRPPGVQMGRCEGPSRWGSLLEHSEPRTWASLR